MVADTAAMRNGIDEPVGLQQPQRLRIDGRLTPVICAEYRVRQPAARLQRSLHMAHAAFACHRAERSDGQSIRSGDCTFKRVCVQVDKK